MELDPYELAFKEGVLANRDINEAWTKYRGSLSFGEFIITWLRERRNSDAND